MKKYPKWDEQSPTRRDPTVDRAPDGIDWHQVAKESSRTRDFCAELFDKIQSLSDAMAFVTHAELDAQVSELQSQLTGFVTQTQLNEVQSQLSDIQSQLTLVPTQAQLDAIQDEIIVLQAVVPINEISALQAALNALQAQVDALPIVVIQGQITTIQGQITALSAIQSQLIELQSQVNALPITAIQSDILALQESAADIQAQVNELPVAAIQTQLNTLQSQVNALPITTIQTNIATLQGQVSTTQTDIGTLQGQITNLQSQITALPIATIQTDITTLQSQMTALQTQANGIRVKAAGATVAAGSNETWLVLAANSSDITGVTLTPVMTMTAVGPGRYWFSCKLIYQTTALSTGIDVAVNHTGTLTQFVAEHKYASGSGAAASESDLSASGATYQVQGTRTKNAIIGGGTTGTDAANSDMISIIEGFFVVSVSGDLQIKLAAEVAGLVCRAMQGSFLELKKLS